MNTIGFTVAVVFGLLLAETRLSRRHERTLREEGAVAPEGDVYRWLAVLYPLAFALMGAEGAWRASAVRVPQGGPSWFTSGVILFIASKALKYWAIHALGKRWTFRVFVVPGQPLVTSGPYRYVAHPNYVAVVGELAGTAMMCGAFIAGPIAGVAFCVVLVARIRFETRALKSIGSRDAAAPKAPAS